MEKNKEINRISKAILDFYDLGIDDYLEPYLKEEKDFYNNLTLDECRKIINKLPDYVDFEVNYLTALNANSKQLSKVRIFNKINRKIIENVDYEPSYDTYKYIVPISDKNKLVIQNFSLALEKLRELQIANIENKFLYFLNQNPNISNDTKHYLLYNMMYINPYLEDKLLCKEDMLEENIKFEDKLGNDLWDIVKEYYNNNLFEYINYVLEILIPEFLYTEEYSEEEFLIHETYLRTIFNVLPPEEIEKLNYNFNNLDLKKFKINRSGYDHIKDAFRQVKRDKELIKKIKTR